MHVRYSCAGTRVVPAGAAPGLSPIRSPEGIPEFWRKVPEHDKAGFDLDARMPFGAPKHYVFADNAGKLI
jgi:hypothetical protein